MMHFIFEDSTSRKEIKLSKLQFFLYSINWFIGDVLKRKTSIGYRLIKFKLTNLKGNQFSQISCLLNIKSLLEPRLILGSKWNTNIFATIKFNTLFEQETSKCIQTGVLLKPAEIIDSVDNSFDFYNFYWFSQEFVNKIGYEDPNAICLNGFEIFLISIVIAFIYISYLSYSTNLSPLKVLEKLKIDRENISASADKKFSEGKVDHVDILFPLILFWVFKKQYDQYHVADWWLLDSGVFWAISLYCLILISRLFFFKKFRTIKDLICVALFNIVSLIAYILYKTGYDVYFFQTYPIILLYILYAIMTFIPAPINEKINEKIGFFINLFKTFLLFITFRK